MFGIFICGTLEVTHWEATQYKQFVLVLPLSNWLRSCASCHALVLSIIASAMITNPFHESSIGGFLQHAQFMVVMCHLFKAVCNTWYSYVIHSLPNSSAEIGVKGSIWIQCMYSEFAERLSIFGLQF